MCLRKVHSYGDAALLPCRQARVFGDKEHRRGLVCLLVLHLRRQRVGRRNATPLSTPAICSSHLYSIIMFITFVQYYHVHHIRTIMFITFVLINKRMILENDHFPYVYYCLLL